MNIGYVYKTTFPNGKVYIGKKHKPEFDTRYIGSGVYVSHYTKKYGKLGVTCQPLAWAESDEALNLMEIEAIDQCRRLYGRQCVNMSDGGDAGPRMAGSDNPNYGKDFSPETRAKIGAASLGRRASCETKAKIGAAQKGVPKSPESNQKRSASMSGKAKSEAHRRHLSLSLMGKPAWNRGKKASEAAIRALSLSHMGQVAWNRRGVLCVTTGEAFASCAAVRETYPSATHVSSVCSGKRKSAGKHPVTGEPLVWRYA